MERSGPGSRGVTPGKGPVPARGSGPDGVYRPRGPGPVRRERYPRPGRARARGPEAEGGTLTF